MIPFKMDQEGRQRPQEENRKFAEGLERNGLRTPGSHLECRTRCKAETAARELLSEDDLPLLFFVAHQQTAGFRVITAQAPIFSDGNGGPGNFGMDQILQFPCGLLVAAMGDLYFTRV